MYYNYKWSDVGKVFPALCLSLMLFFSACQKDKDKTEKAVSFEIEDASGTLEVPLEGTSKTYSIKSDGLWMIAVIDGEDWIKVDPVEGNGNGTFTVTIDKNRTAEERKATLTFKANFQRQNDLLRIDQAENPDPPYFQIEDDPTDLHVSGNDDVSESFTVHSNTAWQVVLAGDADWINIDPAEGNGDGTFTINVDKNPGYTARTATLGFIVDDLKQPDIFEVVQDGKVDESVVLNEDFSWLSYGDAIFYQTNGEKRMDTWTQAELDKGWTSTPVSGSSNQWLVYARQGFVKLGKTGWGGDLISPKLSGITGTKDLLVSFKAVPYQTAAGTKDGTVLRVSVVGPGTVSQSTFDITNWPDYTADPNCTEIWKEPGTTRTFKVTGATSETQIRFLGDDFDVRGIPPGKNRIFLDDIVVTTIN